MLPTPIQTTVSVLGPPGAEITVISRRWSTPQAQACALCPADKCLARHGPDGQSMCTVAVVGVVAPDSAALFRRPDPSG
jgi:hypothetical protein